MITIFTGKGGVGKTSLISAHALLSAQEGTRTLLVSADMAHNIGDLFETETGGSLTHVENGPDLLELDPYRIMQEEFPQVNRALLKMLSGKKAVPDAAEGFMIPGFENLFSLLKIKKIYESGEYGRIFVDCAPSGETLSLLRLPELLSSYMEKFFPVGKAMTRVLRPVTGTLFKVELPDGSAMDEFGEMFAELTALQNLLKDPAVTNVRIVCLPEKMVVEETKRTYMYLNLYGYHVDRVFLNRVLPEHPGNAFLEQWRTIQETYIEEVGAVFAQIPVTKIRWHEKEICGKEALQELCAELPAPQELFAQRPAAAGETYEKEGDGWCLRISLPGLAPAEGAKEAAIGREPGQGSGENPAKNAPGQGSVGSPAVSRHGQDLDVRAGNCVRRIPLPDVLRRMEITEIRAEEEALTVLFLPAGANADPVGANAEPAGANAEPAGANAASAGRPGQQPAGSKGELLS